VAQVSVLRLVLAPWGVQVAVPDVDATVLAGPAACWADCKAIHSRSPSSVGWVTACSPHMLQPPNHGRRPSQGQAADAPVTHNPEGAGKSSRKRQGKGRAALGVRNPLGLAVLLLDLADAVGGP
jgi:hypothetical protein